jgi:hypothetical protein
MRAWVRPLTAETTMWRWYAALVLGNTLDLLFTYTAIERGYTEWNPFVRPLLLTPWAAASKVVLFGVLAYGLWRITQDDPGARRLLRMLRGATLVYLVVVTFHALGLKFGG